MQHALCHPSGKALTRCRCGEGLLPSKVRILITLVTLGALAALLYSSFAPRASPGIMAKTRAGTPVRWTRPEIILQPSGPQRAISSDDLVAALRSSAKAWNQALVDCGVPKLKIAPVAESSRPVRQDGISMVVVRTGSWCPDRAVDSEDCYDRTSAAITQLYPNEQPGNVRDGELQEADIEINAADFAWSLDGEADGTRSLRGIVAHELGHVLGLDHPCVPGMSPNTASSDASTAPVHCDSAAGENSIMEHDPVRRGRRPPLEPRAAEVQPLCRLYPRPRAASCAASWQ